MKKLMPLLFAAILGFGLTSCKSDDGYTVDYDTYPVAMELNNVSFDLIDGVYQIQRTFTNPNHSVDMMLMYMKVGATIDGSPIWQQIPITQYLSDGHEVDYNFDFSRYDFVIYAGGTFNLAGTEFVKNKTFRILIVPADFGRPAHLDYSDYRSVVEYYHIDDGNLKKM